MSKFLGHVRTALPLALLGIFTFLLFSPSLGFQYLTYDDPLHVLSDLFSSPQNIFFTPDSVNWTYIPLSIFSTWVESICFASNPWVTHFINILLHVCAVFLVFVLSCRLGVNRTAAWIAAFIFAVHPMHVESVVWATGRKDLLYADFYLVAMLFYCDYLDKEQGRAYIFALLCAALSILSKPMALSLPLVLFLIDHLKGRKFSLGSIWDKVPFFCVVEPVALITYLQNSRDIAMLWPESFKIWVSSCAFYVNTFFWPAHLFPIYEFPAVDKFRLMVQVFLPVAVFLAAWIVGKAYIRKWLVFASLFYFLSMFFLWRFDVQDFNMVADRWMYLPCFGFCVCLGLVVSEWFRSSRSMFKRVLFWAVIILAAFLMVFKTSQQQGVWRNSFYFWNCILKERPDLSFALKGRIGAFLDMNPVFVRGVDEDIKRSVDRRYWKFIERSGAGEEEVKTKVFYLKYVWALRDLRSFAKHRDNKKDYYFLLGVAYEKFGRNRLGLKNKAFDNYSRAIAMDGSDPDLFFNRGIVALKIGRLQRALMDAMNALKLDPKNPDYYDLAVFCAVTTKNYYLAKYLLDVEATFFPEKDSVGLDIFKIDRLLADPASR